jgi:hypothetical protein
VQGLHHLGHRVLCRMPPRLPLCSMGPKKVLTMPEAFPAEAKSVARALRANARVALSFLFEKVRGEKSTGTFTVDTFKIGTYKQFVDMHKAEILPRVSVGVESLG